MLSLPCNSTRLTMCNVHIIPRQLKKVKDGISYHLPPYCTIKPYVGRINLNTLNKPNIEKIYQMSSLQFFNGFYTLLSKFSVCENK